MKTLKIEFALQQTGIEKPQTTDEYTSPAAPAQMYETLTHTQYLGAFCMEKGSFKELTEYMDALRRPLHQVLQTHVLQPLLTQHYVLINDDMIERLDLELQRRYEFRQVIPYIKDSLQMLQQALILHPHITALEIKVIDIKEVNLNQK
ncbi:MAG: hypothetical protein V7731_13875 [Amphritea sp.]